MGAQDRKGGTWLELPFMRMLKYYLILLLIGIFFGVAIDKIWYWTDWWQVLLSNSANFLIINWWVTPSTIGILSVIIYLNRPKKKKILEVKQQQ